MIILKLKEGDSVPQQGEKRGYMGETYTFQNGIWYNEKRKRVADSYTTKKLFGQESRQQSNPKNGQGALGGGSGGGVRGSFNSAAGGVGIGRAITSAVSNVGKKVMQGVKTSKANIAASNARKPATATAPRSNFSTPTPTYYNSLESGIKGHGLNEDQKKYLESLGVKSVKELQERLNTDLKSGLVVDDKWGKRTQDAFTAGYNAWKNQQQERPQQQQFDYNQLFSQWDQWTRQQPNQQQEVTPMPATYDRYDIRHWLRENNIKGITAGGRKALRHYLNGEDYDTRYQGIVDQYAPMIRGNQRSTQPTPTLDPEVVERFQSLIGTNFNDLPEAYNNLRTNGTNRTNDNVDDMYAPGLWQGAIKNMTPTKRPLPLDFIHKDQNGNISIDWGDPDRFNFSYEL